MAVNTLDEQNNVEGEQGEPGEPGEPGEQEEQPGGHLETKSTIVLVEESARQLRIWLGVPGWCICTILKEFAMCSVVSWCFCSKLHLIAFTWNVVKRASKIVDSTLTSGQSSTRAWSCTYPTRGSVAGMSPMSLCWCLSLKMYVGMLYVCVCLLALWRCTDTVYWLIVCMLGIWKLNLFDQLHLIPSISSILLCHLKSAAAKSTDLHWIILVLLSVASRLSRLLNIVWQRLEAWTRSGTRTSCYSPSHIDSV